MLRLSDAATSGATRSTCPKCGAPVKLPSPPEPVAEVGELSLRLRSLFLIVLPHLHALGVIVGCSILTALGGWIWLVKRWLGDSLARWGDVPTQLGGVRVRSRVPAGRLDFGPVLNRSEASQLLDLVRSMAQRIGVRPPEEVRLAYLPCCGVVAHGGKRIVLVGLPLLPVLTQGELRAILAHEMAHLARGDATRVMGALRFLDALGRAVDEADGTGWGPLLAWSRWCRRVGDRVAQPVARGQETRADRVSALVAGGVVAASALARVAIVQPLFREVLDRHRNGRVNVFTTFRLLWDRLPAPLLDAMRNQLHAERSNAGGDPHPPLADRLATLQSYPDQPETENSHLPASALVNDLEWLEESLQTALFHQGEIRPSVFHRAGS